MIVVKRTFSAAAKLDDLSQDQKEEIESQSRPSAALIHETIRAEGESELTRGTLALAWSGLSAGLSMGFSLATQGKLYAYLPPGVLRETLTPLGYTVGFLIVVLGRQQLFTENTLTPILPLIHNRNVKTLWLVMRFWLIVLVANVLGAVLFAYAFAHAGIFEAKDLQALSAIGQATIRGDFPATFVRAVYAGWLIALMVWLLPAAEGARPWIIIIVSYVISLNGFSHIIAGSVDCAYLVQIGGASWGDFWFRFFTPTLLGNIIGGVMLVAFLNYGQVAPEIEAGTN